MQDDNGNTIIDLNERQRQYRNNKKKEGWKQITLLIPGPLFEELAIFIQRWKNANPNFYKKFRRF